MGKPNSGSVGRLLRHSRHVVAIQIAILVATIAFVAAQISLLTGAVHQLDHASKTIAALTALSDDISDLDAGQRSYLLTGDAAFLAPYARAIRVLDEHITDLGAELAHDPETTRVLRRVTTAKDRRVKFADETIALRRDGRTAEVLHLVRNGTGRQLTDAIHADVHMLIDQWHVTRQRVASEVRERQGVVAFGVTVAAVVTILMIVWNYRTQQGFISELARSEAELRGILSSMVEGVVKQDTSGRIVAANERASQILGLTEDQLMGRDSMDPHWRCMREDGSPFPGEEHPAMVVLRTGSPVRDCVMGVHLPRGEQVWIVVNAKPVFATDTGTITGVVTTFLDITELRNADIGRLQSEARLRAIVENAPDAIFVRDATGRFTEVNPAACRSWGYSREELLRSTVMDVFEGLTLDDAREITNTVESGLPVSFTRSVRRADGSTIPVETRATSLELDGSSHVLCFTRDVSALRAAQQRTLESEKRLQAIIGNVPAMISYWGADLRFEFANQAMLAWFGITDGNVDGRDLRDVLSRPAFAQSLPYMERALGGEVCVFERDDKDSAGRRRHARVTYIPDVADERVRGVFTLITDTTELTHKVQERTRELALARDQAEAANHAKDEILANASHEMRTPLHAIRGFTDLALRQVDAGQSPKLARYLHNIQESAQRLGKFVDDLLSLAKLQTGRTTVEVSAVDLRARAEDIGRSLEVLFLAKRLRFEILLSTSSCVVPADASMVDQVLTNLLSNAVKFSYDGGTIRVTLADDTFVAPDGHSTVSALRMSVSDDGVGIPEPELEAVFEKFRQSSRTKTGAGGTGLGLSITREIMRLHGGTITARNVPGAGAAFDAVFPRAQTGAHTGTAPASPGDVHGPIPLPTAADLSRGVPA
ncbi:MAG: PAS domain S-box protein [Betaproteobacteria bacterium]|nr:PAS domain S-box protein [Betaproteobacteria bacterium]